MPVRSWQWALLALLALSAIAPILAGCAKTMDDRKAPPATQLVLEGNLSPVASYSVGLTVGRHLRAAFIEDGMTADTESILVGMRDGLAGRKPPHDEDRIEEAVLAIEQARAAEVRDSAYLSQLYNEKAKWANEMKRYESNVLETTGGVALERRWREATKHLQKLEAQKEDAVENMPEVLAARQKEEAVRGQMNQLAIEYAGNRAQYLESAYQQQREDWYREQQYNWIRSYPPGYYDDDGGYRYYRRY